MSGNAETERIKYFDGHGDGMRVTEEQRIAIDEKAFVGEDIVRAALARVPPSWNLIKTMQSGAAFRRGGIQVVYTVQRYEDGEIWIHVSASGRRGGG